MDNKHSNRRTMHPTDNKHPRTMRKEGISRLPEDTLGNIVTLCNVPDFLSILFINRDLQEIAKKFPPWSRALTVLEEANGFDVCHGCECRSSKHGRCDCDDGDPWMWQGDAEEAQANAAPLSAISFLRSDPRRNPLYFKQSTLCRLKQMASFTIRATKRLRDEVQNDIEESLNGASSRSSSSEIPSWVTPERLGKKYQHTHDFYSSYLALAKHGLSNLATDVTICRFMYSSERLPVEIPEGYPGAGEPELRRMSARASVMFNLVDSCVAADELFSGQSIYWHNRDYSQERADRTYSGRICVHPSWGSSLRDSKNWYIEGLYGISHWGDEVLVDGPVGSNEHLTYMINLTKECEEKEEEEEEEEEKEELAASVTCGPTTESRGSRYHQRKVIQMFGKKVYEHLFDVHGLLRKNWSEILMRLQDVSDNEDAEMLEEEISWKQRVENAMESEHFKVPEGWRTWWEDDDEEEEEEEEEEEVMDYSAMTVVELRAELKRRNLRTSAPRKEQLILRLEEDDMSTQSESENDESEDSEQDDDNE